VSAEKTLEFVAERQKQLHGQRVAADSKLQEAKKELTAIEREEKALIALERALKPEPAGARSPANEIRRAILGTVQSKPDGLSTSEIMEALDAHGNKTRQDAIRNALHSMKRPRGQKPAELQHQGGRYSVPTAKTAPELGAEAPKAGQ
jgi:hypothetical protein